MRPGLLGLLLAATICLTPGPLRIGVCFQVRSSGSAGPISVLPAGRDIHRFICSTTAAETGFTSTTTPRKYGCPATRRPRGTTVRSRASVQRRSTPSSTAA